MPNINIKINDNTGAEYTGNEQVIFFPGSVEVSDTGLLDDNKCMYISASKYSKLKTLFKIDAPTEEDEKQLTLIEKYLSFNFDVLYHYDSSIGTSDYAIGTNYDFLEDKDLYNVKFLTLGTEKPIQAIYVPANNLSSNQGKEIDPVDKGLLIFNFDRLNQLARIAADRKDCQVPASIDYDAAALKRALITGDDFALCTQVALNLADKKEATETGKEVKISCGKVKVMINYTTTEEGRIDKYYPFVSDNGQFVNLYFPNRKWTTSSRVAGKSVELDVPAGSAYLMSFGNCVGKNIYWLPIANSSRGNVGAFGTSDLIATKYNFDQNIILDKGETNNKFSFNGIVAVRPYTNVIWGDRTLAPIDEVSIKASNYASLMLVVNDIAKTSYDAAVRYTYESNNEVTWLNYKTRIVALLDQIVSAGVLQSYDINRVSSADSASPYNTMACRITIYPNLPVENFDIVVNLENADLAIEE